MFVELESDSLQRNAHANQGSQLGLNSWRWIDVGGCYVSRALSIVCACRVEKLDQISVPLLDVEQETIRQRENGKVEVYIKEVTV